MNTTSEVFAERVTHDEDMGGTDGFRGIYTDLPGPGLMNAKTVGDLTYATVAYQQEVNGANGPVVVAQDTRPHGERLRKAAIAAAQKRGAEIVDLGIAPTPAAQRIASELGAMATIVLTASHNGERYNGIKYMPGRTGENEDRTREGWHKPSKNQVNTISQRYWEQQKNGLILPLEPYGEFQVQYDLLDKYKVTVIEDIRRTFDTEKPLAGKLFIVDGANGAARRLTPSILRELGAHVQEFACDGLGAINDGCGAANLEGAKEFLRQHPEITEDAAFTGVLINDGDADRVVGLGVDENGEIIEINGNHMMWVLATNPIQPGIVGTDYSSSGLVSPLDQSGIGFEYCENGDVNVTNALLERQRRGDNWTRGGEFTGHIIDTTWLSSGDGIRTAAWIASWAATHDMTFGDLYRMLPLWHEEMRWVEFPGKARKMIGQHPEIVKELDRLNKELGTDARFILRPSGTESGVRIWGESPNAQLVELAVSGLADIVRIAAHNKWTGTSL